MIAIVVHLNNYRTKSMIPFLTWTKTDVIDVEIQIRDVSSEKIHFGRRRQLHFPGPFASRRE